MKASGIGRDGGDYSFEFYMETKNVCIAAGTHAVAETGSSDMSLYQLQKFLYHLNRDERVKQALRSPIRRRNSVSTTLPTRSAARCSTATSVCSTCSASTARFSCTMRRT